MGLQGIKNRVGALSALLVLVVSLLNVAAPINAQSPDAITLAISPQILDLTANPGEPQSSTFRLTNVSESSVAIRAIPKNFTPRGEEGAVDLTEDDTSYSLARWMSVTPSEATIQAKKTLDFVVTFDIPENAEPGSHFGSVVFQTIPPENDENNALVSQEIAPVILMKIAGDVTETAEIEEFTSDKSLWSNETAVVFSSRIKNTGTAHFKPTGQIVIKDTFGKEVATLPLDKKNVLPDSIRAIETEWQIDGFKIGRYTAELTVVYGENDEIRTATTSFVIFPYQTIIPVAVIISIVGFLMYKARRRLKLAMKALSGAEGSDAGKKD